MKRIVSLCIDDDLLCFDDPYKEIAYRIIKRAILDAYGHVSWIHVSRQGARRVTQQDAKDWIKSTSKEPLTYEYLCDALDLDPDLFRKELGL